MESKKRILLVEDSAVIRKLLRQELAPLEMEVVEAGNGRTALELVAKEPFDLILTGIVIPEVDGYQLCKHLKNDPRTRTIPVIIVSGLNSDQEINRGFECGASAFVAKQEAHQFLRETVEKLLSKTQRHHGQVVAVVEDMAIIRTVVQRGLVEAGFQVLTAANGLEALRLFQNQRPDLILSDINMPEMDGFALCQAVHADPELAAIPYVVMSSHDDRAHMQRILQYGAEAYLVKPFNIDELIILIDKLLADHFLLLLKEKEWLQSERTRLANEQQLTIAGIASLISALEARDSYTRGHSESVSQLVTKMAIQNGASTAELELVALGARLHDIGKIGVKDAVLLKPGRLTEEEFEQIKQHPLIGVNILKNIPSLETILPIVLSHHERLDGKGYPNGLPAAEIPLFARMTAVADTYDALTSDRPYRQGMAKEKAIEIVREASGTQLCPACVELLLQVI